MTTKMLALKKIGYIDNEALFNAVSMALWLILDCDNSLKHSVDTASKKKGYPVKAHITKLIRVGIPQSFFNKRKKSAAANLGSDRWVEAARIKNHMKSISNE